MLRMFSTVILIQVTYVEFVHPEWLILFNINHTVGNVIFFNTHGIEFSNVTI